MSKLLEQYEHILNLKYYKTLKNILSKLHNNKYNSFLENITSEELLTESESINQTQTINQSITISDIKISDNHDYQNNKDINDLYYYKKPWNKLNIVHKKIKVKEYINNLMLTKQKTKILIDKLINLLNNKLLNKKDEIDYDICNGKIITITILKCKNDEYFI
jgi:hypothetical protein